MSRRDDSHFAVRRALEKDGWTITDDPLKLFFRGATLKADLGAEKILTAEKEGRKLAVEIKEFSSDSAISELEKTLGQLLLYQWALAEQEPDRQLFLAVREEVYNEYFTKPLFQTAVARNRINIMVFDYIQEAICQWLTS